MTDCPPKLRGDLSKWLCEIDTGVYVGQISGRVRDAVWERIRKTLTTGHAVMVYATNNEQRMDFRTHNTAWEAVDFDGIKLMRRPPPQSLETPALKPGFSKAAKWNMAAHGRTASAGKPERYVVIDLKTGGLQAKSDPIIEYGALRVENGVPVGRFSALVAQNAPLPPEIAGLTGITDALLRQQGQEPKPALEAFLQFIGNDRLVGYNIMFDIDFLSAACRLHACRLPTNRCKDLLESARRRVSGVSNYKLATLAAHFSLPARQTHRALPDCELIWEIYEKLKQI